MSRPKNARYVKWGFFGGLLLLQVFLHWDVFTKDLVGFHVWRQTQTQNTILSFVQEDGNVLNPRRNERGSGDGIFRMEFPLWQWIIAKTIKLTDLNDVLLSRIMNLLISLFGAVGIYRWIWALFKNKLLAYFASLSYSFFPVLFYYMMNPLPDNFALTMAIWSLTFFEDWRTGKKTMRLIVGLFLLSVASLVKLPFILFYAIPGYFFINEAIARNWKGVFQLLGFSLLSLLPVVAWYAWVIPGWTGNGIVSGIFGMNTDQRSDYFYYLWFHLRTTLPELLLGWPMVPFFLLGLFWLFRSKRSQWRLMGHYPLAFIASSLFILFELNMIEKVHDYYFFPTLPFLLLLLVLGLKFILEQTKSKAIWMGIVGVLLMAGIVNANLRVNSRWDRIGFNQDLLTYKYELQEVVDSGDLVCVGNDDSHHIFLYYVQKMGWAFEKNWITPDQLAKMIDEGCRYLYCDSRDIDQNPVFRQFFGMKIAEYGSIKVFELKLIDP